MPGPIKLEDHSPAYKAYKNLGRPPLNLPPFTIDEHVRSAAIDPTASRDYGIICTIIPIRLRPNLRKNVLSRDLAKLGRFFEKLMRHEEYSGKNARSGGRARKTAMGPSAARPSCGPPSHDDDQDDEEPEVMKRETGGLNGREVMEIDSSPVPEERHTRNRPSEAET
ncbi:hypothetical protein DOTSEDRAFT_26408 [Dothistroma septosporum NZE10]|uniref:Uncharacterized protein n=1 Tax=Dothistroma septosporum (strain NZE10 / CBS 128990) TaxID=675120 RepID=N1PIT8_DOTSN|nr:hypothetical protein DOTSEDRAFT_26408 [Dothistroma septosporum NZE10]